MIPVIYVQLFFCFVAGYLHREFWRDLQTQNDGAGMWLRFWAIIGLATVGFALGGLR